MKNNLPLVLTAILFVLIYIVRVGQGGWEIKTNYFANFRTDLDHRITSLLPSPQAQLLSGILLGSKKDLPGDFKVALRDTSTLHIVVVSGQNLTMLAGLFMALVGIVSRRTAILTSFVAVIFYTFLTGAQVPVLRAALMFTLASTATIFGRQRDGLWALIISAGLMLLINPDWLTDLSFQLSFLATFGVVVAAPIILPFFRFLPSFVSQDLAITLSAQALVTPIIAQSFHQFSLVGVITNVLIGWSVPFIMIFGTMMLIFSYVSLAIAQWLSVFPNILLTYFIYIVEFFASLPFAWEYVGQQSWFVWVGYYLIVASILICYDKTYGKAANY